MSDERFPTEADFRQAEANRRLECLRMAVRDSDKEAEIDNIIAVAREYSNFVEGLVKVDQGDLSDPRDP